MGPLHLGTPLNWKRSLGELSLIVAGVLIALAANSWWEGRKDRQREESYLRQLRSDVRENEERLEQTITFDSTRVTELARFRDAVAGFTLPQMGPIPSGDSLRTWSGGFSFDDFEPLTGTYTALVQTGDVQLVRSDSLRFQVIAYAADMDALLEELRQKENQMWRSYEQYWQSQAWFHLFSHESVDVEAVLGDPELFGLLVTRHVTGLEHVEDLADIRRPTRRLRCLLEAELEGVEAVEAEPAAPGSPSTLIDETVQLRATVHFSSGLVLKGCPFSWASDDDDIASVDDQGLVTGLAAGRATITATLGGISGSTQVSVEPANQ